VLGKIILKILRVMPLVTYWGSVIRMGLLAGKARVVNGLTEPPLQINNNRVVPERYVTRAVF
jgi:hypothetical protein